MTNRLKAYLFTFTASWTRHRRSRENRFPLTSTPDDEGQQHTQHWKLPLPATKQKPISLAKPVNASKSGTKLSSKAHVAGEWDGEAKVLPPRRHLESKHCVPIVMLQMLLHSLLTHDK